MWVVECGVQGLGQSVCDTTQRESARVSDDTQRKRERLYARSTLETATTCQERGRETESERERERAREIESVRDSTQRGGWGGVGEGGALVTTHERERALDSER